MKKLILLSVLAVTCLSAKAINIVGEITDTQTWTLDNSPYIVIGPVSIKAGGKLIIENGVEVRFSDGYQLTNKGTLNATGVSFTSNTGTTPGKWKGLLLHAGSTSNLSNITIRHAEYPLSIEDGVCTLNITGDNTFENNTYQGGKWNFYKVNANFTLPKLPVPWLMTNTKTVTNGARLTIGPGVTLKCYFKCSIEIQNGSMQALGTAEDPILITSYRDAEAGGYTENGTMEAGYWKTICFKSGSADDNQLFHCTIRYGGHNEPLGWGTYSNPRRLSLQVWDNTGLSLTNCTLEKSIHGIHIEDNATVKMHNTILNGKEYPMVMRPHAILEMTDCGLDFTDMNYKAILMDCEGGYELKHNTQLKPISFTNAPAIAYGLNGKITVPEGKTLEIDPGIVIKAYRENNYIQVKGKLTANGTAENPIVFTSWHDDSQANPGDSNNNGESSVPSLGQGGGIIFHESADNTSSLKHVQFHYAKCGDYFPFLEEHVYAHSAISCFNASPVIENCSFYECDYGVKAFGTSTVTIKNCTFDNIKKTPVAFNASAHPLLQNNNWGENIKYRALGLLGQKTGSIGKISCLNDAGYENLTYLLLDNWIIPQGVRTEIDPGVVIKVWDGKHIFVRGGLKISGMADKHIVFTEIRDDNYGSPADTENDGANSQPAIKRWKGICYYNGGDTAFSRISYADFRYGGGNGLRESYEYTSGITPLSYAANLHNTYESGTVTFSRTAVNINNSSFFSCGNGLAYYGAEATGKATDIIIENCDHCPVMQTWNAKPVFTNMQFVNNTYQAIGLQDHKIDYDATLTKTTGITGSNTTDNAVYISWGTYVLPGKTVQVDPGIIIKNSGFKVEGTLKLNGTAAEHITLTSIHDDSKGGDTNNNGNSSSPNKSNWSYDSYGVLFNNSTSDNLLTFTDIIYTSSGVCFRSSRATIEDCNIEQCQYKGVSIEGTTSNATIRRTAFNNLEIPVRKHAFATASLHENNTAANVNYMGIELIGENFTASGTLPLYNFAGHADITYRLNETLTVGSGVTLTIPAGASFKNVSGNCFKVKGTLNIEGTAEKPVVITDQRDDTYGSPLDFNQDGTVTQNYTRNNLTLIDFETGSSGTLQHLILKSNGCGLLINGASPTLRNIRFEDLGRGISMSGISSAPIIENSLFHNSYYPLETSLLCFPASLAGNTFSGSSFKGIKVPEETLNQNTTLTSRSFGELTNAPYIFDNYTVNAELTINPGVICKFNNNKGMTVNRWLKAVGTVEKPIIFTSIRDDFYGGDTNADTTATAANGSLWNGIVFNDASIDADCRIKFAVIKNAHEAITTNSANPTLEDVTFYSNRNAVYAKAASNPVITRCDFVGMTQRAVNNINQSFTIEATDCWWGSQEGPVIGEVPSGNRQAVSAGVNTAPYNPNGLNQPLLGDVSSNGTLQAYDASLVLQKAVGSISLEPHQIRAADVSNDNQITAYDATLILEYVAGLRTHLPAGLKVKRHEPDEALLEIGSGTILPESDLLLPVSMSGTPASVGVDLILSYNPAFLHAIEVLPASGMNFMQASRIDNEQGEIHIAAASTNGRAGENWNLIRFRLSETINADFRTDISASLFQINNMNKNTSAISGTVIYRTPTGIDTQTESAAIHCFPNPAKDILYLSGTQANAKVSIYNLSGQKIQSSVYNGSLNISSLLSGAYMLEVEQQGSIRKVRFLKQ